MSDELDPGIRQKWRPPLILVIGGTLAAVFSLPLLGVAHFKLAGGILGWGETAWLIFFIALVVTALLGFLLWRLVLKPVKALTRHATAVKHGRHGPPLPTHFGTPEFRDLGQSVIDMAATLQDREAGLRAYTNHVTHELKSPLTSVIGAAELLQQDAPKEDREALIRTIRDSAQTMQKQLEALRNLAAAREPFGPGPSELSDVVETLESDIDVEVKSDGSVPIDPQALSAILTQLISNAQAHGAKRVTIQSTKNGFSVNDDGSGIAEGNRSRIFDPFFTTRRASGGTGMGLAIVQTMLEAADGKIRLEPTQQGTRLTVSFIQWTAFENDSQKH